MINYKIRFYKTRSLILTVIILIIPGCELTHDNMNENYINHKQSFFEVDSFFRSKYKIHFIEFKDADHIDIIIWDSAKNSYTKIYEHWNILINDTKLNEALNKVNWTSHDIKELYTYLKSINCFRIGVSPIKIHNSDVIELMYRRQLLAAYDYLIFPDSISKNEMEKISYYDKDKVHYLDQRIGWSRSYPR